MPTDLSLERAIRGINEDLLGRDTYAARFVETLVNRKNGRSTGVIVGVAGEWGTGKSSLLNMIAEHVEKTYPKSIVVRFDPWLISGREDLITEFLGEFLGKISPEISRRSDQKSLLAALAEYGAYFATFANSAVPGAGGIIGGTLKQAAKQLRKKPSLSTLRHNVEKLISKIDVPIVVLVDELDRLDDDEVHAMAQLVRSVVDFPSVSYVLAYDHDRIVQALGRDAGSDPSDRVERGTAYLEKIVQHEIHLPVLTGEELFRVFQGEIESISEDLELPNDWAEDSRYKDLVQYLFPHAIKTMRNLKRLLGQFGIFRRMVKQEINWIDLIAYSALAAIAPQTAKRIRVRATMLLVAHTDFIFEASEEKREAEEFDDWFNNTAPKAERAKAVKLLVRFLFPRLFEISDGFEDNPDLLRQTRPLLTLARLGGMPGYFTRDEVLALLKMDATNLYDELHKHWNQESFISLFQRIEEVYPTEMNLPHWSIWKGFSAFAKKPDDRWMASYSNMRFVVEGMAELLIKATALDELEPKMRLNILEMTRSEGCVEIETEVLWEHMWGHGLFNQRKSEMTSYLFDEKETEDLICKRTKEWQKLHLATRWLPGLWELTPVYMMLRTKTWNSDCVSRLLELLDTDGDIALDGLTLMFTGGHYTTSLETVDQIIGLSNFLERVEKRTQNAAFELTHPSLQSAYQKAMRLQPK